jgi:HK97 family phage prohead protease
MAIQYKSVAVGGVSTVEDEGDGVITAFVSVTGVEDNVKDIIEPGAYQETLSMRKPKGVWGHQWLKPVSKTLAADELQPGDPNLPKELSNGQPWPEEAGALRIKMQFNMNTPRGRDAYEDVKFFDSEQEWSIGYAVPSDGAYKDDNGVRHIKKLSLFEYSPVLFGAMTHARTSSVKSAQLGMKLLEGVGPAEIKALEDALEEYKEEHLSDLPEDDTAGDDFVGDEQSPDVDVTEVDEIEPPDDDEIDADDEDPHMHVEDDEDSQVKALATKLTPSELRDAIATFEKVLGVIDSPADDQDLMQVGDKAFIEAKATLYDTVAEAVDAIDVTLDDSDAKALQDGAVALDDALDSDDAAEIESAAEGLLDALEKAMDYVEEDDSSLRAVARVVADKVMKGEDPEDDKEDDEDEDVDDEEDDSEKETSFWGSGKKPKGKKVYVAPDGTEFKNLKYGNRTFGYPVGGTDVVSPRLRVKAFVGGLDNYALSALSSVLEGVRGNVGIKAAVNNEIESREYTGEWDEKAGQEGRGGGFHRMAAEGRTPDTGPAKPKPKRPRFADRAKKGSVSPSRLNGAPAAKKRAKKVPTDTDRTSVSTKDRKSRMTMEDGSFPIGNTNDLKNAIQAHGRAKDKDAAKRHIMNCAKKLGKSDLIPDDWKSETIDTSEVKSLESFLNDLDI